MRTLSRSGIIASLLGLVVVLATMQSGLASAQTPTATPTATPVVNPLILAGSGEPGYAVNLFGSTAVTVAQGATITFKGNWFEPHTVTLLPAGQQPPPPGSPQEDAPTNPGQTPAIDGTTFVNSGLFFGNVPPGAPIPTQFQASFPKTGTFPLVCLLHQGMGISVTVVAPGTAGISTQAQLDTAAQSTFATALSGLKAAAATIASKPPVPTTNADGTRTWTAVTVGGNTPPANDIQQFTPGNLNIQAGDTVVWNETAFTPHTVTFLGGTPLGGPLTSLADPRLTPKAAPVGGYDGTGVVNSGIMFGPGVPLPFPAPSTFSVKFTKAGTYPYICILHVDQGMGGTITVSAASVAPAPPKTGSAGLASESSWLPALLMAAFAVTLLAGARVASRRTR